MGLFNRKPKVSPEKELVDALMNLAIEARKMSVHPPFNPDDHSKQGWHAPFCPDYKPAGGAAVPSPEAHLGRVPAKCAQCGHLFDRETGQSREVTAGKFRKVTIFFCSMHIPAWETAEVDQVEGSLSMGQLKNFRKSFPVDAKGRIKSKHSK